MYSTLAYFVEHGTSREPFPDQDSAESALLRYCLNGESCALIYPDNYSDYGAPPPERFDPLDVSKIISLIGIDRYNDMIDCADDWGYGVFRNIQEEDEDIIAEIRGEV